MVSATAFHLIYAGLLPLSPQEAYYWQWSRRLALSYFDHPPLATWSIRATTELFGHSERAVRLAAAIHSALFCTFLFLSGRRLFGARPALIALCFSLLTPLGSLGQVVITPDGPLGAAWIAAFYFTIRALDEERGGWLLGAGAAAGLAALSKYTGLLLWPQIGAMLLLDARGRRLLRGPWPWAGLGLASGLFVPVLLWNGHHGWSSFGFQLSRLSHLGPLSPRRLGAFVGQQSLILSPVLFVLLVAALVSGARRWRDPAMRACVLFSLPLLSVCLALAPFLWVKPNWPAPAWATALLAGSGFWDTWRQRRTGVAVTALVAALSTALLHAVPLWPLLPMPARDDVTRGWPALGDRVGAELSLLPPSAFVLGCSYWAASELAYYVPGRPRTYGGNALGDAQGLEYSVWLAPGELDGREGIVVRDRRELSGCAQLAERCSPLQPLAPMEVRRGESTVTTFELWRCRYSQPHAETAIVPLH